MAIVIKVSFNSDKHLANHLTLVQHLHVKNSKKFRSLSTSRPTESVMHDQPSRKSKSPSAVWDFYIKSEVNFRTHLFLLRSDVQERLQLQLFHVNITYASKDARFFYQNKSRFDIRLLNKCVKAFQLLCHGHKFKLIVLKNKLNSLSRHNAYSSQ